jgi:hypothetical protein
MSWALAPHFGLWFPGMPQWNFSQGTPGYSLANNTIDAAAEKVAFIGQLWLADRGSNKSFSDGTVSGTAGKIYWQAGSPIAFTGAGTTVRVGVQDMDATDTTLPGQPDGTFDVYDDLVGGTDTITALTTQTTTMSSGSKTLNHGDLIAVVFDMTSEDGVATDSVLVQGWSCQGTAGLPRVNTFAAAAWSSQNQYPIVILEMDDGTLGILDGAFPVFHSNGNNITYNSGSSPNEYGLIFQVPFPCKIDAVRLLGTCANGSADGEIVVYSDPLGTPSAMHTHTVDASYHGSTSQRSMTFAFGSEVELAANTNYGVTFKPTTANNVTLGRWDVNTTPDKLLQLIGGSNVKQVSRASGAFTESASFVPMLDVRITSLSDGAGGAGGLLTHPGMAGGMRG